MTDRHEMQGRKRALQHRVRSTGGLACVDGCGFMRVIGYHPQSSQPGGRMMKLLIRRCAALTAACAFLAQGSIAPAQDNPLDPHAFQLTMGLVHGYLDATENLYQALEEDPTLLDGLDDAGEDYGSEPELRAMIETLNAQPTARGAIERSGLSVREYTLVNATLIPAFITVQLRAAGLGHALAVEWLSEQHIEFTEQHAEEIGLLFDRLQEFAPLDDQD